MRRTLFHRAVWLAFVMGLVVVVLGAYVRLSDAGLGCPDWPTCYGHLAVPDQYSDIQRANKAYPERRLEAPKAWKEMVHRYFAGILGLLIFILAALAWRRRHTTQHSVVLLLMLAALVVFQALLGMWTVTLLLKPVVVVAHLLAGIAMLALLWWLLLRAGRYMLIPETEVPQGLRRWTWLGLLIVIVQLSLGGWTSANYAALACPDFPTCQTYWWPPMDFKEAFILWRGTGIDYEGGVLDNDTRVTIQFGHRLGALVTLLYVGWLLFSIYAATHQRALRAVVLVTAFILIAQVCLGITNVVMSLPLPVAVTHTGGALLLVLALVTLIHVLHPPKPVSAGAQAANTHP
jgi:Uncharacterized protein required for cytochrome oxidase assembly